MKSDRLVQGNFTGPIRPTAKIISHTSYPIGTLYTVWTGTRYGRCLDPKVVQEIYDGNWTEDRRDEVEFICKCYPEYTGSWTSRKTQASSVILAIAQKVIESNVPAGEAVHLNIQIDNASVAWREQLVRGRISQQFWTMSTRIMDMTSMDVNMNDSINLIGGEEAVKIYEDTVQTIRDAYTKLIDLGIPVEDIRLQPQNHVHRVYWMVPLRTLVTILNKRSDWIAQGSLWTPIVSSIILALRQIGLYNVIAPFIGKPMVEFSKDPEGNYFVSKYIMEADNEDRYSGRDKLPCDPLWLAYRHKTMPAHTNIEHYDYLKSVYMNIWSDEYLEILGWDRENPEQLGYYDRPQA